MSKQRPTPDRITNELAGASAFFKPSKSAPVEPPSSSAIPASTPPTPPVAPIETERPPRTPGRPAKRQMIRHPFELYMDQLDSLRELAEAQRRRGELGSMSRMVRQAIDDYVDQHPLED